MTHLKAPTVKKWKIMAFLKKITIKNRTDEEKQKLNGKPF